MNRTEIKRAFEEIFDQALVFHGFAIHCVRATVTTEVRDDVWKRSLNDQLIKYETGVDLDGFVWGVKWQCLYPGLELGEGSTTAAEWSERIGIDFHEATITTEAQSISLVFSDLEVTQAIPGETPFTVTDDGPYFKIPLP